MRIVFEDEELEGFVMEGGSLIAVPVQIDVPEDGESVLTVYSGFVKLAEKFLKKFENDPLSPDALRFIEDHFTKPMEKAIVPILECLPSDISGISSSTTTYIMAPAAKARK